MTAADLKDLTRWGPFTGSLSHVDLVCRLRVLRAFCQLYIPPPAPIVKALWLAESGEPAEVEEARIEFDALPALTIRRILGSYAEHLESPQD